MNQLSVRSTRQVQSCEIFNPIPHTCVCTTESKLTADPDGNVVSGVPVVLSPCRRPRGGTSGTCLWPHLSLLKVVQCCAAALSVRSVGGSGTNASWDSES